MKADLHNHSINSPDGGATYKQIVDSAHKNGAAYLAITDHDYQPSIDDMLEIDQYAQARGMNVFLGVENSTAGGVHVQSFYTKIVGREAEADVKQYLVDRKNLLEGIDQAGELMHAIYASEVKSNGQPCSLSLSEIEKLAGRASYQTLFFFTALGEKFPELHGKGFAVNRAGAKKAHSETFDSKEPSTMRYLQTSCDLADLPEEFHHLLKEKYNIVIPEGSTDFNTGDLIAFVKKYEGLSTLAHPGLIVREKFESSIRDWKDAGLDAISCEGYPYEHINKGVHQSWALSVDEFNTHLKKLAQELGLATSGGTDSHEPFNGLSAGEFAFEATGNKLIPKLLKAKEEFYKYCGACVSK